MHVKAGLFSAVLTGFIIDRNQAIQPTPVQQSAFFQQQSVLLLNQISQQLSSLGAPIPVLSDSSLPGFTLSPSATDVRVNIIWIISLVFSLAAALLATLIRQWAQDHMRIFQRSSHPLVVARIRQYLYGGGSREDLHKLAEAVPGFVHISLFLFLVGLTDLFLNTYTTVGRFTLIPTVLCATLYIIITVAPVMNPQFLYRTPCSPLFWSATKMPWIQWIRDRFGSKCRLDSHMSLGQIQLAMERSEARQNRDELAIRWLAKSLTYNVEDSESLALGIPGSFDSMWGVEVWKGVSTYACDKLYGDIGRLFETCSDYGSFQSKGEWRVRSRACTEAIALFVFFMNADIGRIRSSWKLLSDIGSDGRTREESEIISNQTFAIHWTCLSLAASREMLNSPQLRRHVDDTLLNLAKLSWEDNLHLTQAETALRNARRIDKQCAAAWDTVEVLGQVFSISEEDDPTVTRERITEILGQNEPETTPILDQVALMDASLSELQQRIDEVTHRLIRNLPGVAFDDDDISGSTALEQSLGFLANPVRPQLIYFSKLLRGLRGVNQEWSNQRPNEIVKTLISLEYISLSLSKSRLMERQLWRLKDLSSGAFGFTIELYFLSIRKLLSTFSSPPGGIHKIVLINTFKSITSDWQRFEESIGTLQVILDLVCDIAVSDRGIFSNYSYPDYIKTELLDLLGRMVGGLANANIDDVVTELSRDGLFVRDPVFRDGALRIIRRRLVPVAPNYVPYVQICGSK